MMVAVRFEQLRAQRRKSREIYRLVGMLDLAGVKNVVEDRSKATQVPKSDYIDFHLGTPGSAAGGPHLC
jgi:hypothetical protein